MRLYRGWALGLILLIGVTAEPPQAWGQIMLGPVQVSGFYQYEMSIATQHANPNNMTCLLGPCVPGLEKKPGKPTFNLMRQYLDLNVYGKLSDNWSVTLEPRFFHDLTKTADGHFPIYQSLATNYTGDGWMLRGGTKDFQAELWQGYVNYAKGNWWVRLGKQQIAWGEALGLRVLDTVNPLDLTQFIAFDRIYEEFDRIRIPEWFLRTDYTIPTQAIPDLTVEFIANPGVWSPNLLAPQGAPYNVVPAFLKIDDHVKQTLPTLGGRITGTAGNTQFSLNFVSKPNDGAIGVFKDFDGGCFAPPYDPLACRVILDGRHPRVNIAGGSMNYNWGSAGAVLRFETTVTPDAPFLRTVDGTPVSILTRPVWKSVVAVDRPTYIFPHASSTVLGFQLLETYTGGDLNGVTDATGSTIDSAVTQVTAFAQQPLFMKSLSLEFFGMFDAGDQQWLQPGIHYERGNHIRLDLYYNQFSGSGKKNPGQRFGSFFAFANGPFVRFTYGF